MSGSTVAVIMGGCSSERDVSLKSGLAVCGALERLGHHVLPIDSANSSHLFNSLTQRRVDAAFIALHGRHGEDGCVQGVLELLGVPYTGSGVLASALAMDKLRAKELFRLNNVPTPPYYVVDSDAAVADMHGAFGFPVVVKPRSDGSSLGVTLVQEQDQLSNAVADALACGGGGALVERYVEGTELAVGLLGDQVLGTIEIVPPGEMFDHDAKYGSRDTHYHCPPRLDSTRVLGVENLARRAAEALGCRGACRVDLLATPGQNEYVLEVNTLPGMTESSLLPRIAANAGLDFNQLCQAILDAARLDTSRPEDFRIPLPKLIQLEEPRRLAAV